MSKRQFTFLFCFLVLSLLPLASAFAQTGTPPAAINTSTPTSTPSFDNYGLSPAFVTSLITLLIIPLVLILAKNIIDWLWPHIANVLNRIFFRNDPTRDYLKSFVSDHKDVHKWVVKAFIDVLERQWRPELRDLYVPARINLNLSDSESRGNIFTRLWQRGTSGLPEALRQSRSHLALIGAAGSGKSTELRLAGLACAQALLGQRLSPEQKNIVRALGKPLFPIIFPLGAYHTYCLTVGDDAYTAKSLLTFVCQRFKLHTKYVLDVSFFEKKLAQGCLLLFDGMDEVPPDCRDQVYAAVQDLLRDYAQGWGRAILTSRPSARETVFASDFRVCNLEPLTYRERKLLFQKLSRSQYGHETQAQRREIDDLLVHIQTGDSKTRELAGTPLNCLSFALVYRRNKNEFPKSRAQLYEDLLHIIAEGVYRADDSRIASGAAPNQPAAQNVLVVLSHLAFYMHQQSAGESGLPEKELAAAIAGHFENDSGRAANFLRSVANQSGWLDERDSVFAFRSHRSYQEFLAGRHLAGELLRSSSEAQATLLSEKIGNDQWVDPLRLGLGYLALDKEQPQKADELIHTIVSLGHTATLADYARAVAGMALADFPKERSQNFLKQNPDFTKQLVEVLERNPPSLPGAQLRRDLGLALAVLGDPRFAVETMFTHDWLTRAFITIPAKTFKMGTSDEEEKVALEMKGDAVSLPIRAEKPQHEVTVSEFAIGKYPITNAEYRHFVVSDDYDNKNYWTTEGWKWRKGKLREPISFTLTKITLRFLVNLLSFIQTSGDSEFSSERGLMNLQDRAVAKRRQPFYWDDSQWNVDNVPVVGVTWFEVQAYCQWLTAKLRAANVISEKQEVRLPTEAEWECAARGVEGRLWAWGSEWDKEKCNSGESSFSETTPVGIYPQGATPEGVMDMTGNVWEWCQSKYKSYPYRVDDGREELTGTDNRLLRGGSWFDFQRNCRVASRYWFTPLDFNLNIGFRVALSPISSWIPESLES